MSKIHGIGSMTTYYMKLRLLILDCIRQKSYMWCAEHVTSMNLIRYHSQARNTNLSINQYHTPCRVSLRKLTMRMPYAHVPRQEAQLGERTLSVSLLQG